MRPSPSAPLLNRVPTSPGCGMVFGPYDPPPPKKKRRRKKKQTRPRQQAQWIIWCNVPYDGSGFEARAGKLRSRSRFSYLHTQRPGLATRVGCEHRRNPFPQDPSGHVCWWLPFTDTTHQKKKETGHHRRSGLQHWQRKVVTFLAANPTLFSLQTHPTSVPPTATGFLKKIRRTTLPLQGFGSF